MNHLSIINPNNTITLANWKLDGTNISESTKNISQLKNVFADETARSKMLQDTLVYQVQAHYPVKEGVSGGLFFGSTIMQPGKVANEYFMTRGHFHAQKDRCEYYWCVQGYGMLILMDANRKTWAEKMYPGSLHFISGNIAHRIANTGTSQLIIGACWPSDSGHDYESIEQKGFSARLFDINGMPTLVEQQ